MKPIRVRVLGPLSAHEAMGYARAIVDLHHDSFSQAADTLHEWLDARGWTLSVHDNVYMLSPKEDDE